MPDREQEFEAPEQSHTASASGESPTPFSETGEQLIRRTPMGYVWNQAGAIWLFLSLLIFEVVIRRSLPKGETNDFDLVSTIAIPWGAPGEKRRLADRGWRSRSGSRRGESGRRRSPG